MATNESLEEEVKKGRMREDFYHRISGVKLHVPPLRERREDIELLALYFLKKNAARVDEKVHTIAPEAMAAMFTYRWPGNVRELENAIKGALTYAKDKELKLSDFPVLTEKIVDQNQCRICMSTRFVELPPYVHVERQVKRGYFEELLRRTNGSIPRAAEHAGLSAQGLRKLLKALEEKEKSARTKVKKPRKATH
jgi:DNA-binding NtrC family response regulator